MGQTIPGGYYFDTLTKKYHDAWGKPVAHESDATLKKAKEATATLTPDQAELLQQEAQTTRAAAEAQVVADVAANKAKAAVVRGGGKKSAKK